MKNFYSTTKFFFVFLFTFILFLQHQTSFGQACDQLEIIFTEPECYATRDQNGSPSGGDKECKHVSACEDQPYRYISSLSGVGYTYLWAATGPTSVSYFPNNSSQLVNIVWPQVGEYTLTLTVTDGLGNVFTSCVTIDVKEKPVAAFSFSPNNVCKGSTVQFNNLSTFPNGGMVYSWTFGDPASGGDNVSTDPNPSHIFNTPGTYDVCLVASSFATVLVVPEQGTGQGKEEFAVKTCCSDTLCLKVTILDGGVQINCVTTVCAGEKSTYEAIGCASPVWMTPIGGTLLSAVGNDATILWGNGAVQGQIIVACPPGCTTTVPVPIIPTAPVPVGNLVPCIDATTSYTLPILPGTFYTWTLINQTTGVPVSPTLFNIYTYPDNNTVNINWAQVGANGTDDYLLKIDLENRHNCCQTTGGVIIKPRGKFDSFFDQTICLNSAANLSVNPTLGTFNWTISPTTGVSPPIGSSPSFTPTFSTPGSYIATVTETANTYCNSYLPQTIKIEVLPATPLPSTITGPTTVCLGSLVGYNMALPAPVGYHYTWSIVGGTGVLSSTTGNSNSITWSVLPGTISAVLERDDFPPCSSPNVTLNVSAATAGTVSGPVNTCVDGDVVYTVSGGTLPPGEPQTWTISPASLGTIISGQGTSSVTIKWHGGVGPGTWGPATVSATSACGPASSLGGITIYPKFTFTISKTGDICDFGPPAGAQLTANAVAFSPTYDWPATGSTTNPSYSTVAGWNFLTITNAGGCTYTNKIFLEDPLRLATNCEVSKCNGANVTKTLLASVASPASGTFTYEWYSGTFPTGILVSTVTTTATSNTFTVNDAVNPLGAYYVLVKYKNCQKMITYFAEKVCCPDINNPVITNVRQLNCFDYQFTGTVNPSSTAPLTWDFGDGTPLVTGTSGVPILHTYATAGVYCVKFCAGPPNINPTNCTGNCTLTSVIVPIKAQFLAEMKCNGCLEITNSSINLSSSPAVVTYNWDFGDSSPIVSTTSPTPPAHCYPSSGGTYTITLTMNYNNNLLPPNNIVCSSIATQNITFTPLSIVVSPLPVCTTNPVSFSSNPGGFDFWAWDFGDMTFAYTASTTHIYSAPALSNTISLSVTDKFGTVCTASVTGDIYAGSPCVIAPAFLCPGGAATLTGPAGGTSYAWQFFDGINWVPAAGANNLINYTSSIAGQFRVLVTNSFGCICTSNAVNIVPVANPVAKISISPSKKLCFPGGFIFLTSENHVSGDIANWYAGSIVLGSELPGSGIGGSTIGVNVPATTTFFLVHINQYGCQDICSITVEVNPLPVAPVIIPPGGGTFCEGTPIVFTVVNYANNITWNTGNVGTSITASIAGSYTATRTDPITGCTNSTTRTIKPRPSTELYPHFCQKVTCDCKLPFAIYAPLPLVGQFATANSIKWFDVTNTQILTGISGGGYVYDNPTGGVQTGTYHIEVTNSYGCISTSDNYAITVPTAEECADCGCQGGSWGITTLTTINPTTMVPFTQTFTCPQTGNITCGIPYILDATYNCSSKACDSRVDYTITNPLLVTTSGTLPYLSFDPTLPGTYVVTLTPYCNGIPCAPCRITFNACPALDVSLISFSGKKTGQNIVLDWKTSSELNNDYFNLERSSNGSYFETIAKIMSQNSNSNENLSYTYTDLFPIDGINYYRLKAVEKNGKESDSRIISVDLAELGEAKVYPNPSKSNNVTVVVPIHSAGKIGLEFVDILGRILHSEKYSAIKGVNKYQVDVSKMPAGKYLIRVVANHESKVLPFEKLE